MPLLVRLVLLVLVLVPLVLLVPLVPQVPLVLLVPLPRHHSDYRAADRVLYRAAGRRSGRLISSFPSSQCAQMRSGDRLVAHTIEPHPLIELRYRLKVDRTGVGGDHLIGLLR